MILRSRHQLIIHTTVSPTPPLNDPTHDSCQTTRVACRLQSSLSLGSVTRLQSVLGFNKPPTQVLDERLIKSGHIQGRVPVHKSERVLFGPDNNIGKMFLLLMKKDPKYQIFLPEFPLLHLRKSKIKNQHPDCDPYAKSYKMIPY